MMKDMKDILVVESCAVPSIFLEVGPTWWMRTALHSGRPLAPYSMAQAVETLGLGASRGVTSYI